MSLENNDKNEKDDFKIISIDDNDLDLDQIHDE